MSWIASACPCCLSEDFLKEPAILAPFVANRIFGWEPFKITKEMKLYDFEEGHAYSICSSLECNQCGLLFLDLRFSKKELKKYYNGYQTEEFFQQREKYEASFSNRRKNNFQTGSGIIAGHFNKIPEVENFISNSNFIPKHILDYGGGDGTGTPFNKIAKILHIFEVDNKDLKFGKPADIHTIYKNKYDLILLRNVIEHTSCPDEILENIYKACSKDTIVYIEVPKEKILDKFPAGKRAVNKKIWHEHINIYNEESIKKLAQRMGFKILDFDVLKIGSGNSSPGDNDREHFMVNLKKQSEKI